MKKPLSLSLILALLNLSSCGQQGTNTIAKPSSAIPYTATTQQKNDFVQDVCANYGGDKDHDGICDAIEVDLSTKYGKDCTTTPDCNNNGVPDGVETKNWLKNPFNASMLQLGLMALPALATAGTLGTLAVLGKLKKSGTQTVGTSTGQNIEISHKDLWVKLSQQYFQKIGSDHYVTQFGKVSTSETTFGNLKVSGDMIACLHSHMRSLSPASSGYAFQLESLYTNQHNAERMSEATLRTLCTSSTQDIFFVALPIAPDSFEINILNPSALGYYLASGTGEDYHDLFYASEQSHLKFGNLMTYPINMQWQDALGNNASNVYYTNQTFSASCNEQCRMPQLLDSSTFDTDVNQINQSIPAGDAPGVL